jgi:regulatory protein
METRRAPATLDGDKLWEYALRLLAQRPNSSSEIRQKLARRAESPNAVNAVLNKLREYGFADDQKFSEAYAAARLQNQGFGRMRILRDLRSKRVAASLAHNAIEKTFAGIDEIQLARNFIDRKYRGKNLPEMFADPKHLASAYRRLRLAGFTSGAAISALKSYSKQADELQDFPDDE